MRRTLAGIANLLLMLVFAFVSIATHGQASEGTCVWAGRAYPDGEFKVNGRVCQVCNAGKWVDRNAKCETCKPKTKPAVTNPPPSVKDCTAQHEPDNPQKLTFSDGARVEQSGGTFQMCSAGVWQERDTPQSIACK